LEFVSDLDCGNGLESEGFDGLTVPKTTEELRISVLLVRVTLRMEISRMTGAEMVVTRRRMEAMRRRRTPTLWGVVSCLVCGIYLFILFWDGGVPVEGRCSLHDADDSEGSLR